MEGGGEPYRTEPALVVYCSPLYMYNTQGVCSNVLSMFMFLLPCVNCGLFIIGDFAPRFVSSYSRYYVMECSSWPHIHVLTLNPHQCQLSMGIQPYKNCHYRRTARYLGIKLMADEENIENLFLNQCTLRVRRSRSWSAQVGHVLLLAERRCNMGSECLASVGQAY